MYICRRESRGVCIIGAIVIASVVFAISDRAAAGFASAGFDHFESMGTWDFSQSPIPSDFFGPGSDPFEGQVALQGVPVNCGDMTDTVVQRLSDFRGDASPATIPVEIVSLHLQSVDPITVTYSGGPPELWWMTATLNPSETSTGQYRLTETSARGGQILDVSNTWFDAALGVEFVLVNGGGPPDVRVMPDVPQFIGLVADAPFSYSAPSIFDHSDNGGFFPGYPPDPAVVESIFDLRVPLVFQGNELQLSLRLADVPEPATMALLAIGGLLLLTRKPRAQGV